MGKLVPRSRVGLEFQYADEEWDKIRTELPTVTDSWLVSEVLQIRIELEQVATAWLMPDYPREKTQEDHDKCASLAKSARAIIESLEDDGQQFYTRDDLKRMATVDGEKDELIDLLSRQMQRWEV